MAWPPTIEDLKDDKSITLGDSRDDTRLQRNLNAAIAYVERVRAGEFNFDGDPVSDLPDPPADMELGVLRQAARWYIRPRSPDGLVDMGELGTGRVPSFDPDIERMLGIGRYRGPVFA